MTKKLTCTPQEFNLHTRCKVLVTVFGFFPLIFAFIRFGAWCSASTITGIFIASIIADRKNCRSMKIVRQKSPNGKKIYLYYDYGRAKGDRVTTGLFLYAKPANAIEKQHNRQT